ncbi:MAG: TonB-dependent receptor [Bacteroidales bacterium]|nr:TonB-dependent receptor [Bacteroidales bacterium]
MKTKRISSFLLMVAVFMCFGVSALAQERHISGKVVDSNGDPIAGAVVIAREGAFTVGQSTDLDGNYSIDVPASVRTLTFSMLSYEDVTETIGGRSVINVVMPDASLYLEEAVSIGYAKVKRKDLTGSSVSVAGSEIAQVPVTTAAQALTGKAAGVNITTQSGAPGASVNITVRGGTSITQSTSPLYIVDGFAMENGLQNVDINDIESIDVLKDASATAIYGAQGSNGVILITTKSGKAGKTQVTYNGYVEFEKLGKKLALLGVEDYVKYQYEFMEMAGKMSSWINMFGDFGAPSNAYSYISSKYGNATPIDWQDAVFGGNAMTQAHNVNITGGNEQTRFMVSYNHMGQNGIMEKHGYTKNSIRAKINHELFKGVRMDFNINFSDTDVEGGGSLGGTLKKTILQPVTGGVRYTNEQMLTTDLGDEMLAIDSQYDLNNPILENRAVDQHNYTRQFGANGGIEFDFLKHFTWRTAGSYSWYSTRNTYWDNGTTRSAQNYKTDTQTTGVHPWGRLNHGERHSYQITNTLNYAQQFDKHSLNVLLGQETLFNNSISDNNTYYGFAENNFGLNDISMAQSYNRSSGYSSSALVSFFGRVMYNYADRYLLTVSLRADGSSKFAKGNKWGFFPSASAAWRISEEDFYKDSGIKNVMNRAKLRIGYGTSGNCNVDNNMYATDYGSGHYAINKTDVSTLKPGNTVGNPKLKWETTTSFNVGLDLGFARDRVNLSVDWYNNESQDLIIRNNIPTSTGYSYQYQNIGAIRNRGVELVLNTVNVETRDFRWTTDFNISFNRSKVLAIYGEGDNDYFTRSEDEGHCNYMIRVNEPIGQFYGYQYDGIYTTDMFDQLADGSYLLKDGIAYDKNRKRADIKPGDFKIKRQSELVDADGNPQFSTTGNDDRVVLGNAMPLFTGGLTNTITWKGFDLNVFMNFSYGNKIFNMSTQRFIGPYLPNQTMVAEMGNRFTLIDPATGKETKDLARLAALNPNQKDANMMWSINSDNKLAITCPMDKYMEDGSFLRLNTITLGYTLPKQLTSKCHIDMLRIYATLSNIHTFTKYSGYDPEVSNSSSILAAGMDNSAYPRAKGCVIGLNITF